jgi:hypothetical protein
MNLKIKLLTLFLFAGLTQKANAITWFEVTLANPQPFYVTYATSFTTPEAIDGERGISFVQQAFGNTVLVGVDEMEVLESNTIYLQTVGSNSQVCGSIFINRDLGGIWPSVIIADASAGTCRTHSMPDTLKNPTPGCQEADCHIVYSSPFFVSDVEPLKQSKDLRYLRDQAIRSIADQILEEDDNGRSGGEQICNGTCPQGQTCTALFLEDPDKKNIQTNPKVEWVISHGHQTYKLTFKDGPLSDWKGKIGCACSVLPQ